MQDLKQKLKALLKGSKRIALLGVGSELHADDAAGIIIATRLKGLSSKVKVFIGGTAPENLSGEIKRFKPTHLVIFDVAGLNQEPGTVCLLDPKDCCGISFSTHRLPIKFLTNYLLESLSCSIIVVAIQPKVIKFSNQVSPEVKKAISLVIKAFTSLKKGVA